MKTKYFVKLFFVCALLVFALNASAQTELNELLPAEVAEELLANGKIECSSYMKEYTPHLFLNTELGKECTKFWGKTERTKDPVFYFEALFLTKKEPSTEEGTNIADISKRVRSLSSLEGLEYYSNTKKKMRVLYEESYSVISPEDRTRIEDPVNEDANGQVIYSLQKDSTFGKFLYQYSYLQNKNEMLINITNIDSLSLLGVKIIKPENMVSTILVYDTGDYYVTYALVEVDIMSVSIIENKMKKSFEARTEALFTWLLSVFSEIDEKNLKALAE